MIALAAWLVEALGPPVVALIGLAIIIPLMTFLRGVILAIPFIGQQLANALNFVWSWFAGVIGALERDIEYGANTILQIVGHAVIAVAGPLVYYVHGLAAQAAAGVASLWSNVDEVWRYLAGWVTTNINAALTAIAGIHIAIGSINVTIGTLINRIAAAASTLEWVVVKAIPGIDSRITTLEKTAALVPAMAAELASLHALSQEQIKQIAALTSAVATIDTTIGIDGRQIKTLADQLTTVLPLSVIAALGITAIGNLVKVAEDPCYCLSPAGGLSDLPLRVMALENQVS